MIIAICLLSLIGASFSIVYFRNQRSPIEGVSKKIYVQGMDYINDMNSDEVRGRVFDTAQKHKDIALDELYLYVEGVKFQVDLGKKPTYEERVYSELITKIWQKKAKYYAHEYVISEYENVNMDAIQMAVATYKGVISELYDSILESEYVLRKATSLKDLEEAYEIINQF